QAVGAQRFSQRHARTALGRHARSAHATAAAANDKKIEIECWSHVKKSLCDGLMLRRSHNARMNPEQPFVAHPGVTLLLGAGGGVGAALVQALQGRGESVMALGRSSLPSWDYLDETS